MECKEILISDLKEMYKNGTINIEPPYQRKSVWKTKQRLLLLSSLFNGIPIPALIFHGHFDEKRRKIIYDVLDGKQRVETILHFLELNKIKKESKLWVEVDNPNSGKKEYLYYKDLISKKIRKIYGDILEQFFSYKLAVIEYGGNLVDLFGKNVASKEVFVRINSTGSPLKRHEIRHALSAGPFFDLGNILEKKYGKLFIEKWGIASKSDIDRYLLHEFILELCTAVHYHRYSDRRNKLEELLNQHKWNRKETRGISKVFKKIIAWISDIFTNNIIKVTRFKNKSDFYSLFVVLLELYNRNYVNDNKRSNRIAGEFLIGFSRKIQKLDPKIKAYENQRLTHSEQRLLNYVISTRQATDSLKHRELRHEYLLSVLKDGFFLKSKDAKRNFDQNTKDFLWSELIIKTTRPKCPNRKNNKKCKRLLTYEDAQVDHVYPWSKGGPTDLKNARLICSSCNISKKNKVEKNRRN